MVSYNPKEWASIIFNVRQSDTVRTLLPAMSALAVITGLFCYVEIKLLNMAYTSTIAMHSLVGFVISMLLVFRTNTAYERWWEGRKLWGNLVNVSRNMALRLTSMVPSEDAATRQRLRTLIVNYAIALKDHLRGEAKTEKLAPMPGIATGMGHVPNAIATALYAELLRLRHHGTISEEQLLAMDGLHSQLTDICGACERIRKTPIPYSYSAFIKKFIFLYVISLPFGIVSDFNYATVPVTVFVFYILASLELIAEEIEDPFGTDTNDLPTDEIAEGIRASVSEIL